MARLYANENFPFPVVLALRNLGHDVLTVCETGKADQAWPDEDVLEYATQDDRALLTFNRKHFVRLQETQTHAGIIAGTFDPYFVSLAQRIDELVREHTNLAGQLFRVNRPSECLSGNYCFPDFARIVAGSSRLQVGDFAAKVRQGGFATAVETKYFPFSAAAKATRDCVGSLERPGRASGGCFATHANRSNTLGVLCCGLDQDRHLGVHPGRSDAALDLAVEVANEDVATRAEEESSGHDIRCRVQSGRWE